MSTPGQSAGSESAGSESPEGRRARRAASFGSQAAAYAEHRPDYAQDAVAWALEPVSGRGRIRVLDLGAGTGKLTGVIAGLAGTDLGERLSVIAVEPDPAMLAELRAGLPGVEAVPGKAEDIPVPDASVDAVLCGQAAHWFDMDKALPEMARVLTPGGVFAGLWNMDDDREEWVAGLREVCEATNTLSGWRSNVRDVPGATRGKDQFGPPDRAEFPHGQQRTVDSLVATIATHSRQLVMTPAERAGQLDRVRAYLLSRPETAHGEFRLPMLTGVLRSIRK